MKHSIPHPLGYERGCQVIKLAFDAYSKKLPQYSPKADWTSESEADIAFSIKGMTIDGKVQVLDKSVNVELNIPFMLRPFKAKAFEMIEGEIKKWIEKEKSS